MMTFQILFKECIQLLFLIQGPRVDLCAEGFCIWYQLNDMVSWFMRRELVKGFL